MGAAGKEQIVVDFIKYYDELDGELQKLIKNATKDDSLILDMQALKALSRPSLDLFFACRAVITLYGNSIKFSQFFDEMYSKFEPEKDDPLKIMMDQIKECHKQNKKLEL